MKDISEKKRKNSFAASRAGLWVKRILRWYLIYEVIGVLIPPMIQKSFTKTAMAPYMQTDAASEGAASERVASEGAASERAASEGAASERAASEGAASERAASEGAASERTASESAASERAASEGAASERAASEGAASERAAVLTDNEDALVWRLRLIGGAKRSIVYTTFAWHDGRSGRQVMAALHDAAERGVKVQVLIDGFTAVPLKHNPYFQALASDRGVTVKIYNPVNLLLPFRVQYRMHDKYMIVDDETYLLGGRNTYNLFLGDYGEHHNIDYEVMVQGSIAQLESYFESIWEGGYCRTYSPRRSAKVRDAAEEMEDLCVHFSQLHPDLKDEVSVSDVTVPVSNVRLISGQTQPSSKDPVVAQQVFSLCENKEDVKVQTPYIICNRAMYRSLQKITEGGTRLEIMTNAVENGANPFGCTDYLSQKKKILGTGRASANGWAGSPSMRRCCSSMTTLS